MTDRVLRFVPGHPGRARVPARVARPATSSPVSCSPPSSCRSAWATRRRPACRPSRVCTRRSSRSSSMRCSGPARSWCWARTRRSRRSSPRPSPRWPSAIRAVRRTWPPGSRSSPGRSASPSGVLRLGLLTDLLSKPIRIGYLNGIALTVFVGQLPKLFGFSVDADGRRRETRGVRRGGHRRPDQPDGARDRARVDRRHRRRSAAGGRRSPGS